MSSKKYSEVGKPPKKLGSAWWSSRKRYQTHMDIVDTNDTTFWKLPHVKLSGTYWKSMSIVRITALWLVYNMCSSQLSIVEGD